MKIHSHDDVKIAFVDRDDEMIIWHRREEMMQKK